MTRGICSDPIKEKEKNEKISKALKGRVRTKEHAQKIGDALRGRPISEETKMKIRASTLGKKKSPDHCKHIAMAFSGGKHPRQGKHNSQEQNEILRIRMTGDKNSFYGKHHCDKTKELISIANKGLRRKPQSYETLLKLCESQYGGFWYGAVRYKETVVYCRRFNDNFKERVRAYWNYTCFECGLPQSKNITKRGYMKLPIHHVHYDKQMCCNGSPQDVVPLCHSCHNKTVHNRDYWESHFTELLYTHSLDGKCFFTEAEMKEYKKHYIK